MARPAIAARRSEHRFYSALAVLLGAITFVGFARTYYLRHWFPDFHDQAAPEPIFQVHGALVTLWFVWLILQASLVRLGHLPLHRTLGLAGIAIALPMALVGIYGATVAAARPGGFIGVDLPGAQFLAVPFFDMVMFGLFFTWAVIRRKDPQAHKRLIVFATANLLQAAVVRLPFSFIANGLPISSFYGAWLVFLIMVAWDVWSLRRLHFVTVVAGVLTLASQFGRLVLLGTDAWAGFAAWLIALCQGAS
jgi:hypothetical protein